ncbi:hypothetical protein [Massilia sp. DD77]|uniref:hypothetical protein n=1 Tax=Massilia sp. DD77 TaxID=3109349 RepID=UPI0030007296
MTTALAQREAQSEAAQLPPIDRNLFPDRVQEHLERLVGFLKKDVVVLVFAAKWRLARDA